MSEELMRMREDYEDLIEHIEEHEGFLAMMRAEQEDLLLVAEAIGKRISALESQIE